MHSILCGVLLLLSPGGRVMEFCGVPFEADYEKVVVTIESDGRRTESRQLYRLSRDSKGRQRMEGSAPAGQGQTLHFAFITDLRNGQIVVVDLATGKSLVRRPPLDQKALGIPQKVPSTPPKPREDLGEPEPQTREDLGEAQIEGLAARGWRVTTPSSVSEVWHAQAIDQPSLLEKYKGPTEEKTERLFNIRIGEPDPQLFAPLEWDQ